LCRDVTMGGFMETEEGLVVIARVPGCPAVLGLVSEIESSDGAKLRRFTFLTPTTKRGRYCSSHLTIPEAMFRTR
jgi:hypothetical protein